MMNINEKAKEIFEQNKKVGWWDDPNRCIFTTLQLINTELSEATEGERKNLMDDHLPHRKMGEVELADALIRTLDVMGRMGIEYSTKEFDLLIARIQTDTMLNRNIATAHLKLTHLVCDIAVSINLDDPYIDEVADNDETSQLVVCLVASIIAVGSLYNYDIISAMNEKLEYNKKRSDHKRENRAKEHGKKF